MRRRLTILFTSFLFASASAAQLVELAQDLTIDVPSAPAQGAFLLDGAPTPSLASENALISLVSEEGESIPIGLTADQGYGPALVLPGRYDAVYDFALSGGALPINTGTPVVTALEFDGSGPVDIDIPTALVTLDLRLNGAPFPVAAGEAAAVTLRHVGSGTEFVVGTTDESPLTFRVVSGTYDVVYGWLEGTQIPRNEHAVVLEDTAFRTDRTVVIDLTAFPHFVQPLINGSPFPVSIAERGAIRLVDPNTGDAIDYGGTDEGVNSRMILPGTYDAVYSHVAGGSIAPANREVVFASDITLSPPAIPTQISASTLDMVAHPVSAIVTFNGVAPPASAAERGRIVFSGPLGDEIDFGTTDAALSTWLLVEGSYDVYYRHLAGSSLAPRNENARIRRRVGIDAAATVAIDIETALLDFDFRIEGAPFPASAAERGRFDLVGQDAGDVIDLGSTEATPSPIRVVNGTYDVVYEWLAGSNVAPRNVGLHAVAGATFTADQTVVVDLPVKVVAPTFLLAGVPFGTDPANAGEIELRDPFGGRLPLGSTHVAVPDSVIAIEGAYKIEYAWSAGDAVPLNPRGRVGFTSVPEPSGATAIACSGVALLLARDRARARRRWGRSAGVWPSARG